jgi:DNA-binding GntR family transcriptional regulator
MSHVRRGSMQEEVVASIRQAITSGRLAPGERLVEQALSEELGVSRAPVREALRQLTGEGLVVAVAHKGTTVVELTKDDILEIYRLRAALEPLAVERLIDLGNPAHLADLRGIVAEIEAALPEREPLAVASLDMRFHERMCELSGLTRLLTAWQGLGNQLRSYFTVADYFYDDRSLVDNHEQLVRVIEKGDLDEAFEVVQRHILGGGESVVRRWAEGGTE